MPKSKNQFAESVTNRLVTFFRNGGEATASELRQRFGIKNVTACISELRKAGYPIYTDSRLIGSFGGANVKTYYHFGSPTRRQMAAGLLVLKSPALLKKLGPQIERNLRLA